MPDHNNLGRRSLVPAKDAAANFGYSSDYVTSLARRGKITARKIGRSWQVDADSLKRFIDQTEKLKNAQAEKIRVARKAERAEHENSAVTDLHERMLGRRIDSGKKVAFSSACVSVLAGAFAFAVFVLAAPAGPASGPLAKVQNQLRSEVGNGMQVANVYTAGVLDLFSASHVETYAGAFLQRVWGWLALVGTESHEVAATDRSATGREDSDAGRRTYRIIESSDAEEERRAEAVRAAFSDEVDVRFEAEVSNGGIVVPRFRDAAADAAYTFVLMRGDAGPDLPVGEDRAHRTNK